MASAPTTTARAQQPEHAEIDWAHYEELAAKSRTAQGLPEKITDPLVLKRIAEAMRPNPR